MRSRRRTVLLSLLAFSAVAALVAAFAPGGDAPAAPVEVAPPIPAMPAPPVAPAELGPALPAANGAPVDVALPSAATPSDSPAPATAGHVPAAQLPAGAARELGPMAAPTFPTMGGDAPTVAAPTDNAAPVAPSPTPAAPSPTPATPQVVEGTSFGAASVRGRSFLIRMSQPVSLLRGVDEGNGFRVVIPDSLSLDRASPIAAAHPLVERAMILNLGDHAELIVTFVEGRVPAYRVVARGHAVELVIGRRPAGRSS